MKISLQIPNDWKTEEVDIEIGDILYHKNGGGYFPWEIIEILKEKLRLRYLTRNTDIIEKSFSVLSHGWYKERAIFSLESIEKPSGLQNKCREGSIGHCKFWIFDEGKFYAHFYVMGINKYFFIKELSTPLSDKKIIDSLISSCTFSFEEIEKIIKNSELNKLLSVKSQINEYVNKLE